MLCGAEQASTACLESVTPRNDGLLSPVVMPQLGLHPQFGDASPRLRRQLPGFNLQSHSSNEITPPSAVFGMKLPPLMLPNGRTASSSRDESAALAALRVTPDHLDEPEPIAITPLHRKSSGLRPRMSMELRAPPSPVILSTDSKLVGNAGPAGPSMDPRSPRNSRPDTPIVRKSLVLPPPLTAEEVPSSSNHPIMPLLQLVPSPPPSGQRERLRGPRPSPRHRILDALSVESGSTSATEMSEAPYVEITPRIVDFDCSLLDLGAFSSFSGGGRREPAFSEPNDMEGRSMNPFAHVGSCLEDLPEVTPRDWIGHRTTALKLISSPIQALPPVQENNGIARSAVRKPAALRHTPSPYTFDLEGRDAASATSSEVSPAPPDCPSPLIYP